MRRMATLVATALDPDERELLDRFVNALGIYSRLAPADHRAARRLLGGRDRYGECVHRRSWEVRLRRNRPTGGHHMIVLGLILLLIGFLAKISILWTIGIVLVVVGLILALLGSMGRAVGGRRHFY
jgi:hypothetical protein